MSLESSIQAPQTPRPAPRLIFSDKSSVMDSYESYSKNGFTHLLPQSPAERRYEQEKRFLSAIDLTKSNVFVTVQSIIRTMAPDWTSPERLKKEYMMVTVNFEAKNTKNVTMNYILEGEGKFVEQTKEMQTKTVNGEEVNVYVRGAQRDTYTMEWYKKKAQDMLTNKKYFGEDTINSTDPSEVVFTVKFPNSNPARTSFSQEDFMNLTYQALDLKSKTTPSPQLEALKRRQNPYS
jgi:hypothetical protein